MTPSQSCIRLIKGYESCARRRPDGRYDAYLPTPNDTWTIGWGSTGTDVTKGTVWTQQQCDVRFLADLTRFSEGVSTMVSAVPTTQAQFDAMVSLAYNIGLANFRQSSVLTNHLAGHAQTAALAFGLWNRQRDASGKLVELRGLTARRQAEATIYRRAA